MSLVSRDAPLRIVRPVGTAGAGLSQRWVLLPSLPNVVGCGRWAVMRRHLAAFSLVPNLNTALSTLFPPTSHSRLYTFVGESSSAPTAHEVSQHSRLQL